MEAQNIAVDFWHSLEKPGMNGRGSIFHTKHHLLTFLKELVVGLLIGTKVLKHEVSWPVSAMQWLHLPMKVFIAIQGVVFDVTDGKAFYGPGGPYENLAGRDASRGLALNSFDPEVLTDLSEPVDTLTDLSSEEIESLANWKSRFENEYKVVGSLHNPGRWTSRQYARRGCGVLQCFKATALSLSAFEQPYSPLPFQTPPSPLAAISSPGISAWESTGYSQYYAFDEAFDFVFLCLLNLKLSALHKPKLLYGSPSIDSQIESHDHEW